MIRALVVAALVAGGSAALSLGTGQRGEHCGCGAISCEMPCWNCCSPGTCSITQNPTCH